MKLTAKEIRFMVSEPYYSRGYSYYRQLREWLDRDSLINRQ